MDIKFANNASSALVTAIEATSTEIQLVSGTGILFPDLVETTDYFMVTLVDVGSGDYEICKVTGKAADVFTIVRAQEDTTALSFPQNTIVENRFTAGSIQKVLNDADATTTNPGRVRIASVQEVADGVANDAAITPASAASLKEMVGVIKMFAGTFNSDGYPIDSYTQSARTDYHVCDGTHGTPDLRNKFVIGAGLDYNQGTAGGVSEVTPTITVNDTILTIAQIPSHNHTVPVTYGHITEGSWYQNIAAHFAGSVVSGSTGGSMPHTHTATSSTESNIPPYYALSFIMKIA